MNNRIRQQYKCIHRQTLASMYITVIVPKNPVTGQPGGIIVIDKDQLGLYRMIYGEKMVVVQ